MRGSIRPRGSTRSRRRSSPRSIRGGPSCAGRWRRRVRVIRGRVFFRGRLDALSLGIGENGKIVAVKKSLRGDEEVDQDRKSTRLNSSHSQISYAVFCLKKKIYTSA